MLQNNIAADGSFSVTGTGLVCDASFSIQAPTFFSSLMFNCALRKCGRLSATFSRLLSGATNEIPENGEMVSWRRLRRCTR